MKCTHNDCFSCPYDDCISDVAPKGSGGKRKKLSPQEVKMHRQETNKKYYSKNQTKYSQIHREYYRKRKERENNGAS